MNIHGQHVEQNHASLKAIIADDPTRTLEHNIVQVMNRTGLLLQKIQALNYKWQVEGANALKNIDVIRRGHLAQPRNKLSQRPYNYWVVQYDLHPLYAVHDLVQDGVTGTTVIHTRNFNEGYFIKDKAIGVEGE